MPIELKYILPPFVGAGIGWLTNYVAIKLLFRPHVPVNILGFKLQGLIPKRRAEISRSIAQAIEKELLSSGDLATTLNSIDWREEVERTVEEVVEHKFASATGGVTKLPIIGLVGGLISDNLIYHIKYLLSKEILSQIEKKRGSLAKKVTDSVDVERMMSERIDRLDFKRFEGLLTQFIAKELKHIEWIGAIMGFFIGLFQSIVFFFMR